MNQYDANAGLIAQLRSERDDAIARAAELQAALAARTRSEAIEAADKALAAVGLPTYTSLMAFQIRLTVPAETRK